MDTSVFKSHLSQDSSGIWRPTENRFFCDVSYPDFGHKSLFTVEEDSFWFQHRNEVVREIVSRYEISKDGWLLDVGGGNGAVAASLERSGVPVVMLEAGEQGIRNAKLRGISTIIHATLAEAVFPKNSVPTVGIFDVLEHQHKPIEFLGEIHRILRKDGLLFITVPAIQRLWSTDDEVAGHFKRYSSKMLHEELEKSGYDIIYISHFFRILILPIFFFRTIPSLFQKVKKYGNNGLGESDHKATGGLAVKILKSRLRKELLDINNGKRFTFGSSIIAVGRKR